MSLPDEKTDAALFLDEHPELRPAMTASQVLPELKKRSALDVDEEQLYVVQGDALGDEDELYLDALVRGSNPQSTDALARRLFLELDEQNQALVLQRRGAR